MSCPHEAQVLEENILQVAVALGRGEHLGVGCSHINAQSWTSRARALLSPITRNNRDQDLFLQWSLLDPEDKPGPALVPISNLAVKEVTALGEHEGLGEWGQTLQAAQAHLRTQV